MCGIAGKYGLIKQLPINPIIQCLSHRGPDSNGHYESSNKEILLLHTRLSIQDLSEAGCQPFLAHDNQLVITFNGEIYNFKELRKQLQRDGYTFQSHSDTEVIINLYHKYGVDFLDRLEGIYAFAIWDNRNETLFVARDGFGVKPFYYADLPEGFYFASELKAILHFSCISKEIDQTAIANYITYMWSPGKTTMFKEIKKLEPGNAMVIKKGKIQKTWKFYDIHFPDNPALVNTQDAIAETRDLFQNAVERQMVSDVPVGAFLSGGLDSSAIVAYAKEYQPDNRLQCFTIDLQGKGLKEGVVDDLPYAQQVAKYLNVDLNIVRVGPDILKFLEKMIYHLDEPQADPAALNVLMISQLAREQNIKVLLSGAGGDDLFTGYRRHYALTQEKYWSWLPQPIRDIGQSVVRKLPQNITISRRITKAFKYSDLNDNERLVSYFYWTDPVLLKMILSDDVYDNLSGYRPSNPLISSLSNVNINTDPLNKMLYLETKHFLADHNLNYSDKMGMASGVEIRVPFLDKKLVEFASSLPADYKQRGKVGKWILKKAMENVLPKEIIYRPKTGFAAPLRGWIHNDLKDLVDEVLSPVSIKNRNIFNYSGIENLRKLDAENKIDASYTIFSMVCIELWCRIFIDQPFPNYN
ncbi:MAG: asparagine synthase (glutamine-hydrolyzing) [Flavobacteriaceae bacterium]|nr:asparagine synthase (glutamine-hydrolyzing) [Flavobacteriaceae bacterium]